jgi:hypothetical protein
MVPKGTFESYLIRKLAATLLADSIFQRYVLNRHNP